MGGETPLPTATSTALLPNFVQMTLIDPTEIADRSGGTNRTIGAVDETTMRAVLLPTKFTVSVRPAALLLLPTMVPFVMLVFVSLDVASETLETKPLVMVVAVVPDASMPEVSGSGSQA